MKKSGIQTRRSKRRVSATPGHYSCPNPFHSDWESPSSSAKDTITRRAVLNVLSSIARRPVSSICRGCRAVADCKPEVVQHELYAPPRTSADSLKVPSPSEVPHGPT